MSFGEIQTGGGDARRPCGRDPRRSTCALEDRDVSDSGRWAKVAPLHAGTYDAQDVVVSVEEQAAPLCEEGRFLGLQYEVYF